MVYLPHRPECRGALNLPCRLAPSCFAMPLEERQPAGYSNTPHVSRTSCGGYMTIGLKDVRWKRWIGQPATATLTSSVSCYEEAGLDTAPGPLNGRQETAIRTLLTSCRRLITDYCEGILFGFTADSALFPRRKEVAATISLDVPRLRFREERPTFRWEPVKCFSQDAS